MSAIAIITARASSKSIPNKNVKEFCGKPVIAYTIEAALDSGMFDEVMVSTDSEEIAGIARACGAQVPFLRSRAASSDKATTADVLKEVLDEYEKRGRTFDLLGCLYPVAPFLTGERLRQAAETMEISGAASLVPVVRFSYPPQRAFVVRDERLAFQYPEYRRTRSQDLEPIYRDCAQFYLCRVDEFRKHDLLLTENTLPFILSDDEVQEINSVSGWRIAEAKYRVLHGLL